MSAGLTQEEVLRETGIHVGRIEMGKNSIDICTFFKLCVFLEIQLSLVRRHTYFLQNLEGRCQ